MPKAAATNAPPAEPHLDEGWLRGLVESLCSFDRTTASEGERRAAEWLVAQLGELGAEGRVEIEDVHGTFTLPLALASGAGALAGIATMRGRRVLGAALGALAAAAIADDLPPRGRRLRRLLPQRSAYQVVAEIGPQDAERTVVLIAHHDAARPGLLFHPAIPETIHRLYPQAFERTDTSPQLMAPVIGGPLAVVAGAVSGRRWLAALGTILSAGSAATFADIASRDTVPGANDNATGVVALLAIARALADRPTESVRVMLVSTSEEATCEGMHAFAARHFSNLPTESTFFLCLDTLGSPHLLVLRGEGMLGMTEYPSPALDLIDGLAEELGIFLFPNLRLRNATDGVYPLAAGYQCASMCSCTDLKQPANYHWPTDVPENVDFGSVADAIRLTEAVVRRLDERWL
jgi:hypothetical protein